MKVETGNFITRASSGIGTSQKSNLFPVGVIGSGSSACALAAYLSNRGHAVSMLTRDKANSPVLSLDRQLKTFGKLEGSYAISDFTTSERDFFEHSEYVFVATVATAYSSVAARIASYLKPFHKIVLFSSKLGGSLEFKASLNRLGQPDIPVLETDALFACRKQKNESVWIKGIKKWTLYSSVNKSSTIAHGKVLQDLFPGLEPAENVIQRGLTDFGALAHAPIMLANMVQVDKGQKFQFYRQGMTGNTVKIMDQMEAEFAQLSRAYGADLIPMPELLKRYYGCDSTNLLSAMQTVPNYEYSMSPNALNHRFLKEDVSCTLVPASELAAKAEISVPVLDSVITFASVLAGEDLRNSGRTLNKLGLSHMDADSIKAYISS